VQAIQPKLTPLQRALSEAEQGRLPAAIKAVQNILRLRPRDTDAMQVLGLLLTQAGELARAVECLARAVALAPNVAGYRNNYGNALLNSARHQEAAAQFRKALVLDPSYSRAALGLAASLNAAHDSTGAIAACESALATRPHWPEMLLMAANALEAGDQIDAAVKMLSQLPKNAALRSRLLHLLNYTTMPADALALAHRDYYSSVPKVLNRGHKPHREKLRIGILSGDLRVHSVGFFAEAIFKHKPSDVALIVFASNPACHDALETYFRSQSDAWHEVAAHSDQALDSAIRGAELDVLVELSGHTHYGRLPALDQKPAPVIISAIGYPHSTGHPAVDWRIVDSITDPPGAEHHASERLLRLDPCFLAYSAPPDAALEAEVLSRAPRPNDDPSASAHSSPAQPADASLCFASFNLSAKISEDTISLWAQLLAAVPSARLLIKSKSIRDGDAKAHLLARMAAGGIDAGRVDAINYASSMREHLALYRCVHVAIDAVPYNGTTTTCEALWMGVPVVSLCGERHASRVGASLLNAIGKPEWVAQNAAQFVQIAAELIQDHAQLRAFRRDARALMQASALMDTKAYGARWYQAVRQAVD
jgi:protein O-GlcNAc transferase